MKNSLLTMQFDLARLACEASMVIGLRMMVLASGGSKAAREAHLMTFEKMQAAATVTLASFTALSMGRSPEAVGRSAVASYRRKVVANRRRLMRRQ